MEDSVTINLWVKRGIMRVNAECLDFDDPDHVYNQIIAQGKRPEDYGYSHPQKEKYANKSREELIEEIISLRKEILFYMRFV